MKYSVAVIALLGLTGEINAVSLARHHHHKHHESQLVAAHEEPAAAEEATPEKAAEAAPEKAAAKAPEADAAKAEAGDKKEAEGGEKKAEEGGEKKTNAGAADPKDKDASAKRNAVATDAEGNADINDPSKNAASKLESDSKKPAGGDALPKGLEAQDSAEVLAKAKALKSKLAAMTPQDRAIYRDVSEAMESGNRVMKASSTMEEDILNRVDDSHASQGAFDTEAYKKRIEQSNKKPHSEAYPDKNIVYADGNAITSGMSAKV